MRIAACCSALAVFANACASLPNAGPLDQGSALHPRITAVDTATPPRYVLVQLDQPGYVSVLLVEPGHRAALLYPPDSTTDNRLSAGAHRLDFHGAQLLVRRDSIRPIRPLGRRGDSTRRGSTEPRDRTPASIAPTQTFLLLVTSPQPLSFSRIMDKTAGVSIPIDEIEALNAVAKAVKATIPTEPRELGAYYQRIELRRQR